MNICFCINNLGAFGLGATLNSLLKNCSDTNEIDFFFFCAFVDDEIKGSIKRLLLLNSFHGNYTFIDFDPEQAFKKYRSLQGDRTTYGRLLIPDISHLDQIIYLDSDLIVDTDILALKNINLEGKIIGAVGETSFKYSLEHNFYTGILNLHEETTSFNAGVLIINIHDWNRSSVKQKLLAIADQYPNELLAADQTLLNAFFAGNFFNLPVKYNSFWYAHAKPTAANDAIYHFVGSPKPWDLFGKYLHCGYKKWKQYNPGIWMENVLGKYKGEQVRRIWTMRRSYLKLLVRR